MLVQWGFEPDELTLFQKYKGMKNLKFVLGGIVLCSSLSYGQTNVIALKSHAGNVDELLKKEDNFGLHPGMELGGTDSIKYVKSEKIVIAYTYGNFVDTTSYKHEDGKTIEEHLKAIRLNQWYPKTTKFIDFPETIEKMAAERNKIKQNGFSLWFVLSILGLSGVIVKRKIQPY